MYIDNSIKIGDKIKYIQTEEIYIIDNNWNGYLYGYNQKNVLDKCCLKLNEWNEYFVPIDYISYPITYIMNYKSYEYNSIIPYIVHSNYWSKKK